MRRWFETILARRASIVLSLFGTLSHEDDRNPNLAGRLVVFLQDFVCSLRLQMIVVINSCSVIFTLNRLVQFILWMLVQTYFQQTND
jgi:hypothetical protein